MSTRVEERIAKATGEMDANNKLKQAAEEGWELHQITATDNGHLFMHFKRTIEIKTAASPPAADAPPARSSIFSGGGS